MRIAVFVNYRMDRSINAYEVQGHHRQKQCHPDVTDYKLLERTHYFAKVSQSRLKILFQLILVLFKNLLKAPKTTLSFLNFKNYSKGESFLSNAIMGEILLGKQKYNIIDAQFGPVALKPLPYLNWPTLKKYFCYSKCDSRR